MEYKQSHIIILHRINLAFHLFPNNNWKISSWSEAVWELLSYFHFYIVLVKTNKNLWFLGSFQDKVKIKWGRAGISEYYLVISSLKMTKKFSFFNIMYLLSYHLNAANRAIMFNRMYYRHHFLLKSTRHDVDWQV